MSKKKSNCKGPRKKNRYGWDLVASGFYCLRKFHSQISGYETIPSKNIAPFLTKSVMSEEDMIANMFQE